LTVIVQKKHVSLMINFATDKICRAATDYEFLSTNVQKAKAFCTLVDKNS